MTTNPQTNPSHEIPSHLNELKKATVIFVIGGPAVGKGTHCNSLAVELGVTHVSVGDLLRAETKKPGAQHKALIEERMLEGSLAPNDIVQEILEDFLVENIKQGSTKFLIDGFPRSKEQASDFQGRGCNIKAAIHLDSSEEVMRARMSKRAAAEGRIDDKVDIHKKRYEDFVEQSEPIIEFYLARGLYEKIDCGRRMAEAHRDILALVAPLVAEQEAPAA